MMETILILTTMMLHSTKNPVKLSFNILILSTITFILLWEKSGSTWIPMMLMMMFTGGILIMFMILSTFHPNEGASKIKISKWTLMAISTMILFQNTTNSKIPQELSMNLKLFYQSNMTMMLMMMMILSYFSMFILILKKEENSMRMTICRKELDL